LSALFEKIVLFFRCIDRRAGRDAQSRQYNQNEGNDLFFNQQIVLILSFLIVLFVFRSDLAWDLLMEDAYEDLREQIFATEAEFKRFRQLVVNVVISTGKRDSMYVT